MQIKVSDIISIPCLKESYILNDKNYSDNLIDNLEIVGNIIEKPMAHQLYIISEQIKADSESTFINFIKSCNENYVSAVIISEKLISSMEKFKLFIAEEYCSINIPIIIYPGNVFFLELAYNIQNFISEYYKSLLNKIIEINTKFSYISLKCPDIKKIIEYFKSVINNPIIIYDEFFNIIVSTDDYLNEYECIPGTIEKNFLNNLYFYKQSIIFKNLDRPIKEYTRVLFPITFDNRDKAFLAVFEMNTPLSYIDYTILEISATSTLVEMKRLMAIKKIEEKHLNDFLYDLIYRTDNKIDDIKRRAKLLNIIEDSSYCAIIFDLHLKNAHKTSKFDNFEVYSDMISNNITAFIKNENKQSLVSRFGKSLLILYRVNSINNKSYSDIKDICVRLQNILIGKYNFINIHIGIGSIITNIINVSVSYRDALSSISYGKTIYKENTDFIISYNDSALLKIVGQIKDKNILYEMIPESLIRLKKYDKDFSSNLIETLSMYLDCNCNAKKTSEKMFIHYKTMLYRLEKIFNEFDIDLEKSNSRLQIELGLQILSILDMGL